MNRLKNNWILLLLFIMFYSCDFIISGSNARSEIYDFKVSKDSLMKIIYYYNNDPNVEDQDSFFRIEDTNKYFFIAYILDQKKEYKYYIAIPVSELGNAELRLISVENLRTKKLFIVNRKPESKEEKNRRKEVVKNFELELNNFGLEYEHF